ncbi:lycopene cyclase domain-containing protein [Microbacterium immunditiarum]|uniref:Lycopene cyclase domain-containing protein n=1 Tax=Microbacterium immunditiarum TaxID=337480 RepID=A0A7Y9GNU8_9MICO|nr:lycopene cyclase domain-containing protein [Microbacterium immunditiarum]NYE19937.1 lycopene cyclase domain-containing protein [Microbacterium immunditiarum]
MTYVLLSLPFLVIAAATTLATARRSGFARRMAASGIAAVVLVVLTAVFDNVMIGVGLYSYPAEHLSGLRIGLAPIEDFAYPLAAAFLVPAVYTLTRRHQGRS